MGYGGEVVALGLGDELVRWVVVVWSFPKVPPPSPSPKKEKEQTATYGNSVWAEPPPSLD